MAEGHPKQDKSTILRPNRDAMARVASFDKGSSQYWKHNPTNINLKKGMAEGHPSKDKSSILRQNRDPMTRVASYKRCNLWSEYDLALKTESYLRWQKFFKY